MAQGGSRRDRAADLGQAGAVVPPRLARDRREVPKATLDEAGRQGEFIGAGRIHHEDQTRRAGRTAGGCIRQALGGRALDAAIVRQQATERCQVRCRRRFGDPDGQADAHGDGSAVERRLQRHPKERRAAGHCAAGLRCCRRRHSQDTRHGRGSEKAARIARLHDEMFVELGLVPGQPYDVPRIFTWQEILGFITKRK